jgi:hypothetical protein
VVILFWDRLLVQSSWLSEVPPLWVRRFHFAVGLFLGCVAFPRGASSGHCYASRSSPLFEFRLPLESYAQQHLANLPQRVSSSHGLSLPSALAESKVHLPRVCLARFVPPSGFVYPLGGFLPSIPCRFCFTPAALLGFALRRFPLSQGCRSVSAPPRPTYRFSCRSSRCRSTEPARQAAVSGSCPFRESLAPARGFNPSSTGSSLGLPLLGYSGDCLDRAFTRSPLTRFVDPTTSARTHRRLRVSISPRLGLPVHRT